MVNELRGDDYSNPAGANMRQVMIVDDDALVLAMLERLLAVWGYRTVPFGSFEDARTSLSTHLPDALVVDVRLGDYNGLQLVHMAKQSNPAMIVVAVSGFDDPVLRAEAASIGVPYLVKPSELPRLRQYLSAEALDQPDR
jgi:two-component system response regulator RegA